MRAHSNSNMRPSVRQHPDLTKNPAGDLVELLDVHDLALVLGVGERYVYRLVNERRVPFVKLGHYVRFDPNEIQEWLDAARVSETVRGDHSTGRPGPTAQRRLP